MKLPVEIRERIIELMIDNVFRTCVVVPVAKATSCRCPKFDRDAVYQTSQMKALPAMLGAALDIEFYRIFFRKRKFRFRCCCELLAHLENNAQFTENIRHIVVHWCGPESDTAFKLLTKGLRLETLSINISKSTFMHLNERGNFMRSWFPLSYRTVRMSDTLGLDELLRVRGLSNVQVTHVQPKSNSQNMEMDRSCLWEMLSSELTKPRAVRTIQSARISRANL